MVDLTHKFDDKIIFKGQEIKLTLAFDNVLEAYKIINDKSLTQIEQAIYSVSILAEPVKLNVIEKMELLVIIFEYLAGLERRTGSSESALKSLDFQADTGLIYAAFMQDYGIDLYQQQGKLHWFQFIMLLDSLTEKPTLSKVIGYRVMKLPAENKYNREQVQHLRKMKQYYALEQSQEVAEQQLNDGIQGLFSMFGN